MATGKGVNQSPALWTTGAEEKLRIPAAGAVGSSRHRPAGHTGCLWSWAQPWGLRSCAAGAVGELAQACRSYGVSLVLSPALGRSSAPG